MDSAIELIEGLFGADAPADEAGYLAEIHAAWEAPRPALLFLAAPAGRVTVARAFDAEVKLASAGDVAAQFRTAPGLGSLHLFETRIGTRPYGAFGVWLQRKGGDVFGGLFHLGGDWENRVRAAAPFLRICGRLASLGLRRELAAKELGTRVQHLLAEGSMLRVANNEAMASAIEEHDRRLREEQERLAMAQICAAEESANRAKSEFLANMSHEIRTPLTAILGFTELLRAGADRGDEEDRQDYLRTIHASATHLLELVNDILDLSRIEAGRMELERIRCAPQEVVATVMSVMRVRAKEKDLQFTCEWPDGIPSTILTDPLRLKQGLMNLVGNAIKFTQRGGVRLVCRLTGPSERRRMAFDVIDTGIGIPADKLDAIFDAFTQADTSVTREFGGTGLGLAITRRIARAMGGEVEVRSEPGRGSTFTLTIDPGPLEGVPIAPEIRADAITAAAELGQPGQVPCSSARVLLVDDGSTNRKLISLFLKQAGMEVATAENGKIALDRFQEASFDVVLLDMQMPVMDGYAAAREFRARGVRTPIIALTAHAMSGDEQKCLQAGCSGYLSKPVTSERLLTAIADALASAAEPVQSGERSPAMESAPAPPSPQTRKMIVSSLPADDPDFRDIISECVEFLQEHVGLIKEAMAAGDLETVALLAHAIKGTAGTAGFAEFTEPAAVLERLAKEGREDRLPAAFRTIEDLVSWVAVPEA